MMAYTRETWGKAYTYIRNKSYNAREKQFNTLNTNDKISS